VKLQKKRPKAASPKTASLKKPSPKKKNNPKSFFQVLN
jgi:hypothetical protein